MKGELIMTQFTKTGKALSDLRDSLREYGRAIYTEKYQPMQYQGDDLESLSYYESEFLRLNRLFVDTFPRRDGASKDADLVLIQIKCEDVKELIDGNLELLEMGSVGL